MCKSRSRSSRKPNKARLIYFFLGTFIGTSFAIYLWTLYSQLTIVFNQKDQLIPTRIYSDVSRIAPNQSRSHIEERLKALGYTYSHLENRIQFVLHPRDYPPYLVPDNHPTMDAKNLPIVLHFNGPRQSDLLHSIELRDHEIPDVYLEPELVAILSRSGEVKREIRSPLKFDEIPATVWKAIIAIEDQHFLEHNGLDPRGLARAAWVNLKTLSLAQGGSTITQQLVKNLMARRTKNIFLKINEVFLALLLEAKFDKEQILERYLNEVYLGQVGNLEVHGVAEGAEHFFGKKLNDLNLAETALMAGLIRGPGFYSPYRYKSRALERQRLVLRKMVETGQIAEAEARASLKLPIRLAPPQTSTTKAPFFTDYVKAELIRLMKKNLNEQEMIQSGFRVYTTLDTQLNNIAQSTISNGINSLEHQLKIPTGVRLEGALASVEQSTGYIRTLIGGRSYSQSNFNRILNMKRQVGSTFKPIVYLTAFQKGEDANGQAYGAGYLMPDFPWTLVYDKGKQSWSPKNYENNNLGWVSLRTSLSQSINTVAARLGYQVGIENVIKTARTLGIESNLPSVPSLSLGVAELSPIDLLRVYAILGNRGVQEELTVIRGITRTDGTGHTQIVHQQKQVIEPAPVDLLTDILQSVFTEGTASSALKMGFNRIAAGKTGTTNNHRDAWFAGYTPEITTVVWVGMDQNNEKQSVNPRLTGANSALPLWVSYMKKTLEDQPSVGFPESPLIENVQIDQHSGKAALSNCPPLQVITEKYMKDHEPKDKACEASWPNSPNQVIE